MNPNPSKLLTHSSSRCLSGIFCNAKHFFLSNIYWKGANLNLTKIYFPYISPWKLLEFKHFQFLCLDFIFIFSFILVQRRSSLLHSEWKTLSFPHWNCIHFFYFNIYCTRNHKFPFSLCKKTFCSLTLSLLLPVSLTTRCVHVISHEILKEFFASYMFVCVHVCEEHRKHRYTNRKNWKEKNVHVQKKTSCS